MRSRRPRWLGCLWVALAVAVFPAAGLLAASCGEPDPPAAGAGWFTSVDPQTGIQFRCVLWGLNQGLASYCYDPKEAR